MKNSILVIIFFSFTILLAACGHEESKPAATPPPVYSVMTVSPHNLSGSVQLPGQLQPFQLVQLYAKVNGFVKNVPVDRGSMVKKGQVLIVLDAPELLQDEAAAYGRYTQAKANLLTDKDRYHRLLVTSATPGTVSAFDLQAAGSKVEADSATAAGAYAQYKAQEAMKSYLTITAPFDGVITERNVHPGALVGPGDQTAKPMLVLQQLSKLRLVAEIPEQYAGQIKDGESVSFKVNALPGQQFTAKVSRSAQSLNNNYRTEAIEMDVDNARDIFKPGMFAEVILPVSGSATAMVVPRSAIVTTTEKKYVVALQGGMARCIPVQQGNEAGDSVEIFSTLKPGDVVVTNADYHIKEGEQVKVR